MSCDVSINYDATVYLENCKVKGDNSQTYKYGNYKPYKPYNIGDEVIYNGINFYVIKNSTETDDIVTLLKAEPLTVDEANEYGIDSGHLNVYTQTSYNKAFNQNGYGGVAYYSSRNCAIIEALCQR